MTNKECAPFVKSQLSADKVATKYGFLVVIGCTLKDTNFLKRALMKKTTTVSFENPPEAVWFLAFDKKELVGCCCCVLKKDGTEARVKSDVVGIDQRGKGIYGALSKVREDFMKGAGVKRVTCFSTLYSRHQFLKDGYTELGEEKNGVIYMEKRYGD